MIRKQIFDKSVEYVEIYSRSVPIEFREPINGHIEKAFIAGADWADKTMLQEVIEWLDENFYTSDIEFADSYLPEYVLNGNFESKEQMLQSFKERFNIE
jgi:hypothetical protein